MFIRVYPWFVFDPTALRRIGGQPPPGNNHGSHG